MTASAQAKPRLEDLLRFIDQDPSNLALLGDAAVQAFDAGALDLSADLLTRYVRQKPLPPRLANLQGLIAMAQQRFADAATIFRALRESGVDDPGLRFNLAWSKAMTRDYPEALTLLDEAAIAASPRGPVLKIQMLHHLARLDDALEAGDQLAQRHPQDQALAGALASVAIDAEKPDLALRYARQAGDNAEGQAALGILALGAQEVAASLDRFEQALQKAPNNPRALVGKGLGLLTQGDSAGGVAAIDRGAELFTTHIGSWVAAGWGYFLIGDYALARARFERALGIDPNFAESHGGLAAIYAAEGRMTDAARESAIALRLDRHCFGAALAKSLLLQHRGHPQMAKKVIDIALSTPIGPQGQTLMQMLPGFSGGLPR